MFRLIIIFVVVFFAKIEAAHRLSICTIFQDEAPFLREWIEFHKLQGVEHFYLYNNKSQDDFAQVLKPYIISKQVTLVNWPYSYKAGETKEWLKIQKGAYMDCIKKFGSSTKWLAIIDTDEFLFCPSGESLVTFLKSYTQYGGVCVNWLVFGTSNVQTVPKGSLMIELLTNCSSPDHPRNRQTKSIVQPKYVVKCPSPHFCTFSEGRFTVNANKEKVVGLNNRNVVHDAIRINHYWTRTEDYFLEKKCQSRQNRRQYEEVEALQKKAKSYNTHTDTAIMQFVPALRKMMGMKT